MRWPRLRRPLFTWARVVAAFVVILGLLQFLHMMLLNRLDKQTSRTTKMEMLKVLQVEINQVFNTMKDRLEDDLVLDKSGEHRIVNYFFDPEKLSRKYNIKDGVTIISQCSVNHLHHVLKLAEQWSGLLSITVFAPDQHIAFVVRTILKLYFCSSSVRRNVTIHLVIPLTSKVTRISPDFAPSHNEQVDCSNWSLPGETTNEISHNYDLKGYKYPNNLLRNVARTNAKTYFIFVIDIDMLPNDNLHDSFVSFVQRYSLSSINQLLSGNTVYIVPAFEKQSDLAMPSTKEKLVSFWKQGKLRPFYIELCEKCHRQTDYNSWKNLTRSSLLEVGYEVTWVDPWEPFYIGLKSAPIYDERFRQYGFNRISQVCELHVAGYTFAILNNAFLVHQGFKTRRSFHSSKDTEQEYNRIRFRQFKEDLKERYPDSQRRC